MLQDHGFSHELEDTNKNPTNASIQFQLEQAQASYDADGLEEEPSIVRIKPVTSSASRGPIAVPTSGPGAKAKAAPKSGAGGSRRRPEANNPLVVASKARSRTMKNFCEAQRLLKKAGDDAALILHEVAPTLLGADRVADDPTSELLRNRFEMAKMASDLTSGSTAESLREQLFFMACEDPYLKDCRTTILADPTDCVILGVAKDQRDVVFDLYL